jgi:uncharacterized protein YkwD
MKKTLYSLVLVSAILGGCSSSDVKKIEDKVNDTIDNYDGDQPREIIDNEEPVTLNEEMKNLIDIHNSARSDVGVTNKMRWSANIAKDAKIYADILARSGEFEHDPRNQKPQNGGGYANGTYGENLYSYRRSDGKVPTYSMAVEKWLSEKSLYDQEPITSEGADIYGHYTQIVWSNTTKVGCARSQYKTGEFKDGYVVVCKYQTLGNYIGQYPYPK